MPRRISAGQSVPALTSAECRRAIGSAQFSPRQIQIITLILQGKMDKEIAAITGLSEHTIRAYLIRIFSRLGVSNRLGLVIYLFSQHLRDGQPCRGQP